MAIRGLVRRSPPARGTLALLAMLLVLPMPGGAAEIQRRLANDGQLVLEDIPPIPPELAPLLDRYQDTRAIGMLDFAADGQGLFIRSRAEGIEQVHFLAEPGGEPRYATARETRHAPHRGRGRRRSSPRSCRLMAPGRSTTDFERA